VDKSGSWYAFGSERLGQGKENVRAFLQEHTDIRQAIEDQLLERLGMKEPAEQVQAAETEGQED
jgi:recombination protein RecA